MPLPFGFNFSPGPAPFGPLSDGGTRTLNTQPDRSFQFDEVNKSISFGDVYDASIFGTNNVFSFVCMFRRNKASTSDTLFSKYNTTGNQRGILFTINASGQFRINVSSTGSADAFVVGSVGTYTALSWQHVVLTVDNSQTGAAKFNLYVNGVADTFTVVSGTIPGTMAIFNNTSPLRLGAHGTGTSNVLNGYINYAAFTNTVLTSGQAAALYNTATPKIVKDYLGSSVLVGEWFTGTWGGSNYSVTDNSGNGVTGTSANMIDGDLEKDSPYNLVKNVIGVYAQSNGDGRELLASLAAGRTGPQPGMYMFRTATPPAQAYGRINSTVNNNQWPTTSGAYGPEFELLDLRTALGSFCLCKYAVGGTSAATLGQGGVASNWNVATVGSLMDAFKQAITDTIAFWAARGYTIRWRFIRYQGEKDSESVAMSSVFQPNVSNEISMLNAFVGQNPFWYIVKPCNLAIYGPNVGDMRTATDNVVAADPAKRRLIDAQIAVPTGIGADNIHLNAIGNTLVGQALVTAILADL